MRWPWRVTERLTGLKSALSGVVIIAAVTVQSSGLQLLAGLGQIPDGLGLTVLGGVLIRLGLAVLTCLQFASGTQIDYASVHVSSTMTGAG